MIYMIRHVCEGTIEAFRLSQQYEHEYRRILYTVTPTNHRPTWNLWGVEN